MDEEQKVQITSLSNLLDRLPNKHIEAYLHETLTMNSGAETTTEFS